MHHKPAVLSRHDGFGTVARCAHGCIHVQLGHTVLVLDESQYFRFVTMLSESAAAYELHNEARRGEMSGEFPTSEEAPGPDDLEA